MWWWLRFFFFFVDGACTTGSKPIPMVEQNAWVNEIFQWHCKSVVNRSQQGVAIKHIDLDLDCLPLTNALMSDLFIRLFLSIAPSHEFFALANFVDNSESSYIRWYRRWLAKHGGGEGGVTLLLRRLRLPFVTAFLLRCTPIGAEPEACTCTQETNMIEAIRFMFKCGEGKS